MGFVRKSSRGNPYHDERGRFTSAEGCRKKVDYKSARDYEVQTAYRKRAANPPPEVTSYVINGDKTEKVFGNKVQKGMIVEYDQQRAFVCHKLTGGIGNDSPRKRGKSR